MSEVRIAAESRTEFGKGAARRIRRDNKVPAVLYGHGTEPRHITLPGHELMLALKTANVLLTLDIEGKDQLALPRPSSATRSRASSSTSTCSSSVAARRSPSRSRSTSPVTAVPETLVNLDTTTLSVEAEATHIPTGVDVSVDGPGRRRPDPRQGRRAARPASPWSPTRTRWSSTSPPPRPPSSSRPSSPRPRPRSASSTSPPRRSRPPRPRRPPRALVARASPPRLPRARRPRATRPTAEPAASPPVARERAGGRSGRRRRTPAPGWSSASATRARSTPATGTTSASWSPTCWPSGWRGASRRTRRGPRSSRAASAPPGRRPAGGPRQAACLHEPVGRPGDGAARLLQGAARRGSSRSMTSWTSPIGAAAEAGRRRQRPQRAEVDDEGRWVRGLPPGAVRDRPPAGPDGGRATSC